MTEREYTVGDTRGIDSSLLIVLSGCSGAGKSSLLEEMASRGYQTQPEPGRQIVKEQLHIGGDALPWENPVKFAELCISRALFLYNTSFPEERPTIFDRSIIDNILGLRRAGYSIPKHLSIAISKYRYAQSVFLVPPWEELYSIDDERRHSFKDAVEEYGDLLTGYRSFGYQSIIIPEGTIKERADFFEEVLRRKSPNLR